MKFTAGTGRIPLQSAHIPSSFLWALHFEEAPYDTRFSQVQDALKFSKS